MFKSIKMYKAPLFFRAIISKSFYHSTAYGSTRGARSPQSKINFKIHRKKLTFAREGGSWRALGDSEIIKRGAVGRQAQFVPLWPQLLLFVESSLELCGASEFYGNSVVWDKLNFYRPIIMCNHFKLGIIFYFDNLGFMKMLYW